MVPALLPVDRRRCFGLGAAMALAPAVARASGVSPTFAEILSAGRLRIAVSLGNRPYGFRNDHGEIDGIDAAIAGLIARGLDVEPEFSEVPTARRIEALLAGEVHVAANLSITAARTRRVLFTTPYVQADIGVAAGTFLALRRPADLARLRVAVNAGSETEAVTRSVLPLDVQWLPCPTPDAAGEAYMRGEVEAFVASRATVRDLIARHPASRLEYKFTLATRWRGAAVNFGEHDLLRTLNTLLFRAREDGLLAAIYERYTGQPMGHLPGF